MEQASAMDGQLNDNVTAAADDRLSVEGRRRRHRNRQPQTPQVFPEEGNADQTVHSPVQTRPSKNATEWSNAEMED